MFQIIICWSILFKLNYFSHGGKGKYHSLAFIRVDFIKNLNIFLILGKCKAINVIKIFLENYWILGLRPNNYIFLWACNDKFHIFGLQQEWGFRIYFNSFVDVIKIRWKNISSRFVSDEQLLCALIILQSVLFSLFNVNSLHNSKKLL